MTGLGSALGRGIALGAGAALVYAIARDSSTIRALPDGSRDTSSLVDWAWAEKVAIRASGNAPALHPAARAAMEDQYRLLLAEIEAPISAHTGTHLPLSSIALEVMDRPAWIRANMANFRDLLQPIEDFYLRNARSNALGGAATALLERSARIAVGTEMGLLLGYFSRRVLGQYDLGLLGKEPITGGKLYFVEPNIQAVQNTLGVHGEEFRRWIALHEATHAHEFELHPWVRGYMNDTMRSYMRLLTEDAKRQSSIDGAFNFATRLVTNLRQGHNLIGAVQTNQQREHMSRLQALMSLAEGYSNHVMNAVGRTLLPSFDFIHHQVEHRQARRSRVEELFLRVTGMAMKMEQYRKGEHFVDFVVGERGVAFANRAWDSPEQLPTEAEIADPARWIARQEAASA